MTVTAGSISCPTASRGGRQGLVGTLAAGASPVTPFERLRGPYFGAPMSGIVRFARGILCACSGRGALVQPGPEGPLKYAKVFFHSSVSALCYVKVHIAEHRKFLVLGGGSTRKQKRSVQLINMDNRAYDSSKNMRKLSIFPLQIGPRTGFVEAKYPSMRGTFCAICILSEPANVVYSSPNTGCFLKPLAFEEYPTFAALTGGGYIVMCTVRMTKMALLSRLIW